MVAEMVAAEVLKNKVSITIENKHMSEIDEEEYDALCFGGKFYLYAYEDERPSIAGPKPLSLFGIDDMSMHIGTVDDMLNGTSHEEA